MNTMKKADILEQLARLDRVSDIPVGLLRHAGQARKSPYPCHGTPRPVQDGAPPA